MYISRPPKLSSQLTGLDYEYWTSTSSSHPAPTVHPSGRTDYAIFVERELLRLLRHRFRGLLTANHDFVLGFEDTEFPTIYQECLEQVQRAWRTTAEHGDQLDQTETSSPPLRTPVHISHSYTTLQLPNQFFSSPWSADGSSSAAVTPSDEDPTLRLSSLEVPETPISRQFTLSTAEMVLR